MLDNFDEGPGYSFEEDRAYSLQFFTISQQGHTNATAEFGSPTLVWHVAVWPRRSYDPFSIPMTRDDGRIKESDEIIDEFGAARGKVVKDFNRFLERLQARGRHLEAPRDEKPFQLRGPRDWDADTKPLEVFDSEATGFTLWWPDNPPAAGGDPPVNVMSGRDKARPVRSDLRVRVQAEVSVDYSIITFFIDAGKPWNEPPIYLTHEGEITDEMGMRRSKIFRHVKNIKTICEERLEAVDHEGKRLIDLDQLPEPYPVCGTSAVRLVDGHTNSAEALKAAADYLYDGIWMEFCRDFGFNIDSIAGETDVVFANFRGLIMSTCGTDVTEHGKLVRAPEPKDLSETSNPGSMPFPRFDGGGEDKVEPNAVVKAYMPFMRRFSAEGDWRDWIACGIFDWRAIYIAPVGTQSEFAAFDESDFDLQLGIPASIPAGYIPAREVNVASQPADEPHLNGERRAPTTPKNDRPVPFRYLLLTKFEPHRVQVGRMVDRINSLGARRLIAFKDWTAVQDASTWIDHYRRQLDAAFEQRTWERERLHPADELVEIKRALRSISAGLSKLDAGAVGGLPYRTARSRYYAETFSEALKYLHVGNIETWWSYEESAKRGLEPVLKVTASVDERMDKLRTRLEAMKQDILLNLLVTQTEVVQDNTDGLKQLWTEIKSKVSTDDLRVARNTFSISSALSAFFIAGAVASCIGAAGWILGLIYSVYSLELSGTAMLAAGVATCTLILLHVEEMTEFLFDDNQERGYHD